MVHAEPEVLRRLRSQAERALDGERAKAYAEQLLDRILVVASPGSEHSMFAHRRLAELRLERDPWRAALHLRKVLESRPDDDGANALMGLAQALLGNYRAAARAYRRALTLAPGNPWYHHNLGHLLDVGLGQSRQALPNLRLAHSLQPDEPEITASLARCLGGLDEFDEARRFANEACACEPDNPEHQRLREWIERRSGSRCDSAATPNSASARDRAGCDTDWGSGTLPGRDACPARVRPAAGSAEGAQGLPTAQDPPTAQDSPTADESTTMQSLAAEPSNESAWTDAGSGGRRADAHRVRAPQLGKYTSGARDVGATVASRAVLGALRRSMARAGFSQRFVQQACAMWADFRGRRSVRVSKPEVLAAAVEYALARVCCLPGVTQASLARRYGVAPGSISSRYSEIREVLGLSPGDPRYGQR